MVDMVGHVHGLWCMAHMVYNLSIHGRSTWYMVDMVDMVGHGHGLYHMYMVDMVV